MEIQTSLGNNKGYYRENQDRREDFYQLKDSKIKEQAKSIACVVSKSDLAKLPERNRYKMKWDVTLGKQAMQKDYPLVPETPFIEQQSHGFGTAFLVGSRYVLTAAHLVCQPNSDEVDEAKKKDIRLIFDYKMKEKKGCPPSFEGYKIKDVVVHKFSRKGEFADWALLKLDRKVERAALKLNFSRLSEEGGVYMLGHPQGLPLKHAYQSNIQRTMGSCFMTDLDAYKGNSGSPVFDEVTKEVIGILVEGPADLEEENVGGKKMWKIRRVSPGEGYEVCQKISSLQEVFEELNRPKKIFGRSLSRRRRT